MRFFSNKKTLNKLVITDSTSITTLNEIKKQSQYFNELNDLLTKLEVAKSMGFKSIDESIELVTKKLNVLSRFIFNRDLKASDLKQAL